MCWDAWQHARALWMIFRVFWVLFAPRLLVIVLACVCVCVCLLLVILAGMLMGILMVTLCAGTWFAWGEGALRLLPAVVVLAGEREGGREEER